MVKGSAILYALLVAFVLSLLTGSVVMYDQLLRYRVDRLQVKLTLLDNARSGFCLASAMDRELVQQVDLIDLFGEGNDSVEINRFPWGLFEIVSSRAFHGDQYVVQRGITGGSVPQSNEALYLANNNRPLSVCGHTVLRGDCSLPKPGIKTVHIEGQSFQGDEVMYGTRKTSESGPPELALRSQIEEIFNTPASWQAEWADVKDLADTLQRDFALPELVVYSPNNLVLANVHWSGRIRVVAGNKVTIANTSTLTDILVVAPEIVLENGFRGSCQLFAGSKIEIGEYCQLNYPSAVVVLKQDEGEAIRIGEGSKLTGSVISLKEDGINKNLVTLETDAIVTGQVYTTGRFQLKGSVFGSVYCQWFWLETPSATYENHLLNATIDVTQRSLYYVGPALFGEQLGKEVVKWL